jgi:hypothetical protein
VQAYFRELVVTDFAPHVHRLRARTLLLWGACDMLFSDAARRYTVRGVTAKARLISSQQHLRRHVIMTSFWSTSPTSGRCAAC